MEDLFLKKLGGRKGIYALAGGCLIAFLLLGTPIRQILGQALLAALLTAACLPLAKFLDRHMKRAPAALISVAAAMLGVIGLIVLAIPQLISHLTTLIGQLPGLFASVEKLWQQLTETEWFESLRLDSDLPQIWMKELSAYITQEAPKVLSFLAGSVDGLSKAFLSPVIAYYFLRDREMFSYQISLWIPARYRKTVLKMLRQMKKEAGSYLRGQGLICLSVMGLTSLGLMLLGIPSFLTLGVVMGVCELIPYIGPLIGGIPIVLFALPMGITKTLWALVIVIAVQQLEGCILSPRLMAGAVSLHPVYILLLLSLGGLVGGLIGMMAAIPLVVCIRGALHVLYVEKQPDKLVKIFGKDRE